MPYADAIEGNHLFHFAIGIDDVSIKATTTEKMDSLGKEEGLEPHIATSKCLFGCSHALDTRFRRRKRFMKL
jgi:2C-methyl-D-erythritol 2,4-cyclodiphosphate synthase